MLYSCRTCDTKLSIDFSLPEKSMKCDTCNQTFPLVNDIPILVKNPEMYLARTFLYNKNVIRIMNENVSKIDALVNDKNHRLEILIKIKNALLENQLYERSILEEVTPYLNKDDVIQLLLNKEEISFYGGTLEYLHRDWCWSDAGENELKLIFDTISLFSEKYSVVENKNTLIIGAGAGRTAWDMCKIFNSVYAVDSSYCLVSYFYTLLKRNIRFNLITNRNVYSKNNIVTSYEAFINPQNIDNIGKFNFFVGYATKIFLPSESIDVISSVYFSDVLPFHDLLSEVKRILKPSGLFIHYGPLGYHFADLENCMSAEEIKEILEENGFSILDEKMIESSHLYSEISMNKGIIDNWTFVAIKNPQQSLKLSKDSKIIFKSHLQYEIIGDFDVDSIERIILKLKKNGDLEISALIMDILKNCNNKSVENLISTLKSIYNNDEFLVAENIYPVLLDLQKNNIIQILS